MSPRVRRGPTVKKFFVCPMCHRDWRGEPSELTARAVVFLRDVEFAGRGSIRVLKEYKVGDLAPGGSWLAEVRAAVVRLARLLGLELTHETVRQVVREIVPEKFRRRLIAAEERARKWAAKAHNAGRKRGKAFSLKAPVHAGRVMDCWAPEPAVVGRVVATGRKKESW